MAMAGGSADSYDLDALAVSDRFRLFNFTRRDDYLAYLWVLRAMDRLRGMHVAQSHTDDVAAAMDELAAEHDVPRSVGNLRERLSEILAVPVDLSSPEWMREPVRSRAMEEAILAF